MAAPGQVARNHGNDGLLQAGAKVVALKNQRRTTLRCAQIGIGK